MRKIYLYLFVFSSRYVQAVNTLTMETVNVGQGAANFLTLQDAVHGRIVLVFDAGSSSNYIHQKFVPENPKLTVVMEKPGEKVQEAESEEEKVDSSSNSSKGSLNAATHTEQADDEKKIKAYTADKKQPDVSISRLKELGIIPSVDIAPQQIQHMAEIIKGAAQCWFIISHSDRDHMNYVSAIIKKLKDMDQKIGTEESAGAYQNMPKKTFAILGGDWFTNPNFATRDYATDEKATLLALANCNATLIMPYYLDERDVHDMIVRNILGANNTASVTYIKNLQAAYNAANRELATIPFTGTLEDLANKAQIDSSQVPDILKTNLRFWGMNTGTEPNSQSIVASYTDVDNNISFIFTGDAEESTFRAIRGQIMLLKECKDDVIRASLLPTLNTSIDPITQKKHLVFMTVPHHGSRENISPSAYATFMPDGYIFSAGDGESFDHPHKDTYDFIINGQKAISVLATETSQSKPKWYARAGLWKSRLTFKADAFVPLLFRTQKIEDTSSEEQGSNADKKTKKMPEIRRVKYKKINDFSPFIFLSTQTCGNILITSAKQSEDSEIQTIIKIQNDFTTKYNNAEFREDLRSAIGILAEEAQDKEELTTQDIRPSLAPLYYIRDFIMEKLRSGAKFKKTEMEKEMTTEKEEIHALFEYEEAEAKTGGIKSGILLIAKRYPAQFTPTGRASEREAHPSILLYPRLTPEAKREYKKYKEIKKTEEGASKQARLDEREKGD